MTFNSTEPPGHVHASGPVAKMFGARHTLWLLYEPPVDPVNPQYTNSWPLKMELMRSISLASRSSQSKYTAMIWVLGSQVICTGWSSPSSMFVPSILAVTGPPRPVGGAWSTVPSDTKPMWSSMRSPYWPFCHVSNSIPKLGLNPLNPSAPPV